MDVPWPLARELVDLLTARGETLAVAESLTGGQLAAAVTAVPGASAVFLGGVVSYATEVKRAVLGVAQDVVDGPGVVSAPCAAQMAQGARRLLSSTWALSTTGVAGPEEQEGKAPGTVFLGLAGPGTTTSRALQLAGDRAAVQSRTCLEALLLLRDLVA